MYEKPSVIFFLKLYSVGMGVIYVALIALFAFALSLDEMSAAPEDVIILMVVGVMCFVFGLFHFGAVIIGRQRWGYFYGIALIVIGLSSCATWPVTVPLLVMWLKPEVKAWFNPEAMSDVFT